MGNEASQQIKYGEKLENDVNVTWRKIGDNPFAARDGHCACGVGNKLFVFGGVVQTPEGTCYESKDLLVFDVGELYLQVCDHVGVEAFWFFRRVIRTSPSKDWQNLPPPPPLSESLIAIGPT